MPENRSQTIIIIICIGIMLTSLGLYFFTSSDDEVNDSETAIQPSAANEDVLAEGQDVYATYCASCHGVNGEGQNPENPLAPDETGKFPAPPHDETGHTWHHDDDLLLRIIREGGLGGQQFYEMPAFEDQLTTEQMQAVLAYIKTLWTDEQRQNQAEMTNRVRSQ